MCTRDSCAFIPCSFRLLLYSCPRSLVTFVSMDSKMIVGRCLGHFQKVREGIRSPRVETEV